MVSVTLWTYACGDGTTGPPAPDPPRPTTVTVSPATAELTALGATVQLSAEVRDQNGQVMAGTTVTWASSSAAVATVSAAGLVTAVANGTSTITGTAGSASGTAAVTVAQVISTVTVSPAADTVVQGDTARFASVAADANDHPVAEATFAWTSSDTLVAMVDDTGLATGVSAGETMVTATASGVMGVAELTVLSPLPTTVAVRPDKVILTAIGQTTQLTAEVRDQVGGVMAGVPVSWSSADTTVAAVDSLGLVTATGGGATTVTATAGEASGMAVVTVAQSAGSVAVTPPADTIALGDTLRVVAEAYDENGNRVDGAVFMWSSSDESVARVDASGLVHGVAEGVATITVVAGDAQGTSEITVVNPDRAALVAFYEAMDGPNWVNADYWLTDAPLEEWYGVDTDVFGRVVGLDLSGMLDSDVGRLVRHGLEGSIPPQLATLARLERLHLSYNNLTGSIPAEFRNLGELRELSLWGNALAGPIPPEIGDLGDLRELSLWGNALAGPIPPEIGNLGNLTRLQLEGNQLSGPIPVELDNLGNLTRLNLGFNQLTGPIPPELGNLANLTSLQIGGNKFTGVIPSELGNLADLTSLGLNGNQLTGSIPPELGSLADLEWLRLYRNQLTGSIPPELGNLASRYLSGSLHRNA